MEHWDLWGFDKATGAGTTEAGAASVVTSWSLPLTLEWAAAGVSIKPASNFSEEPDCDDGLDNDGDGFTDLADPGCLTGTDPSEFGPQQCDDGVDNDLDGQTDFPDDLDCDQPADPSESLVTTVPAVPVWVIGVLAVGLVSAVHRLRRR